VRGSCAAWWRSSRSASLRRSRRRSGPAGSGGRSRPARRWPPYRRADRVPARVREDPLELYVPLLAASFFEIGSGSAPAPDRGRNCVRPGPRAGRSRRTRDPAEGLLHLRIQAASGPSNADRRPFPFPAPSKTSRNVASLASSRVFSAIVGRPAGPCRSPARPGWRTISSSSAVDRPRRRLVLGQVPTASRPAQRRTSTAREQRVSAGATRPGSSAHRYSGTQCRPPHRAGSRSGGTNRSLPHESAIANSVSKMSGALTRPSSAPASGDPATAITSNFRRVPQVQHGDTETPARSPPRRRRPATFRQAGPSAHRALTCKATDRRSAGPLARLHR